jgi:hypothetical protein
VTIPKISDSDIRAAFGTRPKPVDQFRELWQTELGEVFECPGAKQIGIWLQMAGWDWEILIAAMQDLASRARSPMNEHDPYSHGLRHFSATVIRKTKDRYGRVRPEQQQPKVAA